MVRSPNSQLPRNKSIRNPYALGNNQLQKQFKWVFDALLSTEYYVGSDYGKIYSERREDGRSKIYVDQREMEDKLKFQFVDENEDTTMFLVGSTGVGKTTLIRNFFQIFDRDVSVYDGNLIIYVSLYSMISADGDVKEELLRNSISAAIQEAITYLSGVEFIQRLSSYDDDFYVKFYEFIQANNKHLIHKYSAKPDSCDNLKKGTPQKAVLNWIADETPLDYNLSLLKYYIHLKEKQGNYFKNIIFIVDDVESLSLEHVNIIVDIMLHVKKCLQARKTDRGYFVKSLIAMRNYSFRSIKIERKHTAFREINDTEIILKDTVPSLSEIVHVRVEYLFGHPDIINKYTNKDSLNTAKAVLELILKGLYGKYDNMLLALTHNNIFVSMKLLMRIVSNKQFIGKDEVDYRGAFDIRVSTYLGKGNSCNVLKNDEVFFALAYGEKDIYVDTQDYYLMNIMHYKFKDGINTELWGIYIIQYLLRHGICFSEEGYDCNLSIECNAIIKEILSLYNFPLNNQNVDTTNALNLMLKHLYEGGALQQSISEPKYDDGLHFQRVYHQDLKIFLSRRGAQLYEMLEKNSLLLQIYRDDIDTNLENNDLCTLNLTPHNRISYCIQYIKHLFGEEVGYLRIVRNKKEYLANIGEKMAIVVLLTGVKESILKYFNEVSPDRGTIVQEYNLLVNEVNTFLRGYNENGRFNFEHPVEIDV